jgi:hypothetical protein
MRLPSFADASDDDGAAAESASSFIPSAMMPALRLTPQILDILASLDPLAKKDEDALAATLTAASSE